MNGIGSESDQSFKRRVSCEQSLCMRGCLFERHPSEGGDQALAQLWGLLQGFKDGLDA